MLATYEQIDDLKPWSGWSAEQIEELQNMLRTAVDNFKAVQKRIVKDVQLGAVEYSFGWDILPAMVAEYELKLAEELYAKGPSIELGLELGRLLGNSLRPGLLDGIKALVQSHIASNFIQLYREFIAVGELKLTDVI
jgi:hypothetical protein